MSLLKLKDITKSFGSLCALNHVNLEVEEKSIHSIIGPNGAGKTTLLNIITGLLQPDSGEVIYQEEEITKEKTYRIARKGIARTFQNVRILGTLSVLENIMVGLENGMLNKDSSRRSRRHTVGIFLRLPFRKDKIELEMREKAKSLLEIVGLNGMEYNQAIDLSLVNQRRLEIARALATDPKLLLLDEPTAGMTMTESIGTQKIVRELCKKGMTIIIISHEMRLVTGVADKVSVINFGEKIAEGIVTEVMNDPRVIEAYLGERESIQ